MITENGARLDDMISIRSFLKRILPDSIYRILQKSNIYYKRKRYLIFGRPRLPGETSKARPRRNREDFFDRYCRGRGLDIGFGGDLLLDNCTGWDFEHGDAQYLEGLDNERFDFVYSSHTLEHMVDIEAALQNWWRVLKKGGYLILYVPHRDLYEKKKTLPSRWNKSHNHFFLLDKDEEPDTRGIVPLINRILPDSEIIYAEECREGHTITDPEIHSDGEYSIEVVIKKL